METTVGISYDDDPEKAIAVIREFLSSVPIIPDEPAPQIGVEEFADSSINIGIRYWVPTKDYFDTLYAVNLSVYKQLKEAEITIPYPQRDLHVVSGAGTNQR